MTSCMGRKKLQTDDFCEVLNLIRYIGIDYLMMRLRKTTATMSFISWINTEGECLLINISLSVFQNLSETMFLKISRPLMKPFQSLRNQVEFAAYIDATFAWVLKFTYN